MELARRLGRRIGEELGLPVYLYGRAASEPGRRDLAAVRAGEYEGLAARLARPEWRPDFGPARFEPRSGACAVGAREALLAYNVNLNTTSTRRANAVAFDVRESGRGEGAPGTLKAVKAIGWYLAERGLAQVSMNLTDLAATPLHAAFEEVCRRAEARGLRVTGSEIVGLAPLPACWRRAATSCAASSARWGCRTRSCCASPCARWAWTSCTPSSRRRRSSSTRWPAGRGGGGAGGGPGVGRLAGMSLKAFADETASESPAPGGGSVAACLGALGAALAAMVANLSAHKRGWDERWEEFSGWAEKGIGLQQELLRLVDEDTRAFEGVMAALARPKGTAEEKAARAAALEAATLVAMRVPLEVMRAGRAALEVARAMALEGNPGSASDAGVGALALRSAVLGARLNVRINAAALKDPAPARPALEEAERLAVEAAALEAEIVGIVEERIELR